MYVKYQSSVERHRGFITTHRVDDSYSSLYAAHEKVFVTLGTGEGNGKLKEATYKMDTVEHNLLKNFLWVRNQGLKISSCKILLIAGNLNHYKVA